jgi:peptidyl-prolyl cis-trans isomerase SurA
LFTSNKFRTLFITSILAITLVNNCFAQNAPDQLIDKIVALVNNNIILKSEIDARVGQVLSSNQNVEFSENLWYQILQSSVDNYVLLEQAKLDSIIITDLQVNAALDARIQEIGRQAGGVDALERAWGKSLVQIRAEFREDFREELTIEELRNSKIRNITVTRGEVKNFYEKIPKDSLPLVPESVELAQIVKIPEPKAEAEKKAEELAITLRDSILNHGKDLEELAKIYSDGPSAPRGGQLGLISMNDLVSEYSAAASALRPGAISEVVRTVFGYHIILLKKRVGDKIDTSHILIKVDDDELDEDFAIEELTALRDSLISNPELSFFDVARESSDDKNTNTLGGRLVNPRNGQKSIPLTSLDPALYRIVLLLNDEGDISEPKPFNPEVNNATKAFRIVKLIKKVDEHRANLELDYSLFESIALQDKQMRVFNEWLKSLRKDIYIEYRVPIPAFISNAK